MQFTKIIMFLGLALGVMSIPVADPALHEADAVIARDDDGCLEGRADLAARGEDQDESYVTGC